MIAVKIVYIRFFVHFKYLKKNQLEMVKKWLGQDYVSEFWYGTGLQNTFRSMSRFIDGKEKLYKYWIAYDKNTPFALLITSKINFEKDQFYSKYLSPVSNGITLDLLIGNPSYLGKGLSHQMIKEFLMNKFDDVSDVFIDPAINNPKAIHVYKKAGFQKLEEFIPEWDPSCPCILMHLNNKPIKARGLNSPNFQYLANAFQL